MSGLRPYLVAIRPANALMIGFAVVVGVIVVAPIQLLSLATLTGFLTGFLIAAYAMVVNDYYDREVDRINAPQRPLASGQLGVRAALAFGIALAGLGVASAGLLSVANLSVAILFAALAWLYNAWGKRQGFLGHPVVAASMAIPYVYGGLAVGAASDIYLWLLAAMSFLAGMGREVAKTIADIEGDAIRNVRSLARLAGPVVAARVTVVFFGAAVALSPLPFLVGRVGVVYLALVLIPDIVFALASALLLHSPTRPVALRVKRLALSGMVLGLVAFVVGGLATNVPPQ